MITLGLCTVDRKAPLDACLRSLADQDLSGLPETEFLIVLNNSPAATDKIVDSWIPRLPYNCRKIFEPNQGSNYGRNRIAKEASGKIVVYTDDDVVHERNWLREMVGAFDDPSVSCVGSRVHPKLACAVPKWFKYRRYEGIMMNYDLGDRPADVTEKDPMPYGAGMAIRSEVFDAIGFFRSDLSAMVGTRLTGDETEYMIRILRSGRRIVYRPSAVVYHPIGEDRLSKESVRRRFHDWGISWARMNFERERGFPRIMGAPRYVYRSMFTEGLRYVLAALRFDGAEMFLRTNELVYLYQFAKEFRKLSGKEHGGKAESE